MTKRADSAEPAVGKQLGRPRDARLEKRILDAAIEVYADRGWSGFNFESVSAHSGVGRAAFYRRWSGREELLIDTFKSVTVRPQHVDRSNAREDLQTIALALRINLSGTRGRAGLRLNVEKEHLGAAYAAIAAEITDPRDRQIHEALTKGQERGEINVDADLEAAQRLIVGAVVVDAMRRLDITPTQARRLVEKLVDTVLLGIGTQLGAKQDQ